MLIKRFSKTLTTDMSVSQTLEHLHVTLHKNILCYLQH